MSRILGGGFPVFLSYILVQCSENILDELLKCLALSLCHRVLLKVIKHFVVDAIKGFYKAK